MSDLYKLQHGTVDKLNTPRPAVFTPWSSVESNDGGLVDLNQTTENRDANRHPAAVQALAPPTQDDENSCFGAFLRCLCCGC